MKIKLPEKWIVYLTQLPESGMGYQRVDVFFQDGSRQCDCVVSNSETLDIDDCNVDKAIRDLRLHDNGQPTIP